MIAVAANAIVCGFDPVPVVEASIDTEIIPDTAPPGLIVPPGGTLHEPDVVDVSLRSRRDKDDDARDLGAARAERGRVHEQRRVVIDDGRRRISAKN